MEQDPAIHRTVVGSIEQEVLAYTAGEDILLDQHLVEVDCLGSAAHARMLAAMPTDPPVLTPDEADRLVAELTGIIRRARRGDIEITLQDQDVHLAVERRLTETLGDIGKKIHTGRSRNDQVALDIRLWIREQLVEAGEELTGLIDALLKWGARHDRVPLVGRTHMQPAMPTTVGSWASAFAEGLTEDLDHLASLLDQLNESPLGSAAGYGVPLPIDRKAVADALGFKRPVHNVINAASSRGKVEARVLGALAQVMQTLSRLAQDLILFSLPEFACMRLPAAYCTGSSIMPQKQNPDVLELLRARAPRVKSLEFMVYQVVCGLPSGYSRDLQETKKPLLDGMQITRGSLRIMAGLVPGIEVDGDACRRAFGPGVFATDKALELVAGGMPFRDAYHHVKDRLDELGETDPDEAVARKNHEGAPGGLDWDGQHQRLADSIAPLRAIRTRVYAAYSSLLGVTWPDGV